MPATVVNVRHKHAVCVRQDLWMKEGHRIEAVHLLQLAT